MSDCDAMDTTTALLSQLPRAAEMSDAFLPHPHTIHCLCCFLPPFLSLVF